MEVNLGIWDIAKESDVKKAIYGSGAIVRNFDPTTFDPATATLDMLTSGDININRQDTFENLGTDINNIMYDYMELEIKTGISAATVEVTALNFGLEDLQRIVGGTIDTTTNSLSPSLVLKSTDFHNIAWVGHRLDGGYIAVVIPYALCTSGLALRLTKRGKGQSTITMTAFRTINDKTKPDMLFYSIEGESTGGEEEEDSDSND